MTKLLIARKYTFVTLSICYKRTRSHWQKIFRNFIYLVISSVDCTNNCALQVHTMYYYPDSMQAVDKRLRVYAFACSVNQMHEREHTRS